MDIVFVVDNSFSMEEEQAGLAASFPQMIEVLNSFRGGSLDYRVAVTTTAFPDELFGQPITSAEEGAFLKAPAMTRPWLERNDPDLSATFTQVATVGVEGSGQEQPLRAAVASVTARIDDGTNNDPSGATFLRSDALLAFVIVTDEDDSSGPPSPIPFVTLGLDPVSKFIGELDAAAGDRSHWAAAVIAAQTDCESAFGEANDAVRLKQFVADTGSNAAFGDICEGNLSGSLEAALNTFKVACEEYDVF